jgi:hypothetical protein
VSVALRQLEVGDRGFPRGTFVVHVVRNEENLHERIDALSRENGVTVFASDTAFPMSGQTGVGSNAVVPIKKPRIAMLADEGVRITEYGAAWFTLEQRLGFPFTPVRITGLSRLDMASVDVLVLPQGSSSTYKRLLGDRGIDRLGEWVRNGGTLVTWGSGGVGFVRDADWAAAEINEPGEMSEEAKAERLEAIDALSNSDQPVPPAVSPSASPDDPNYVPGSVVRAELDLTHWLTLGYQRRDLPVLIRGSQFLTLSETGDNPVVVAGEDDLELSGFFWPGNSAKWLAGTAYVAIEPVGGGQIILFHHDPNFRLAWRATSRLFTNAVLLGPSLGIRGPGRF